MSSSKNLGLPTSVPRVSASICKRVRYSAISSDNCSPTSVPGRNRLTPNGRSVSSPTSTSSGSSCSAVRYPAARVPSPPALLTAATSSGVVGPPAIGAPTIGITHSTGPIRTPAPPCASVVVTLPPPYTTQSHLDENTVCQK